MTSLLTKEEQEEMLNQKMEMMKKKNAELIRRHQLVEEDKRLAEQQGRSVTIRNHPASYSPMKGEILRADEEDDKRKTLRNSKNRSAKKYNGPNVKLPTEKTENKDNGPPPDPACKFLADRRREGPLPDHGKREYSRRHPRNFGGVDFNDVPKKIHDEKERQTYQPQIRTKADETLYTTGKERRELEEWRREREKIDRERLERQKNKEGNWRREWDRDKDELSYTDEPIEQIRPLNSRPNQLVPRPDDRFKANGRGRFHQRKKDGHKDSNTAIACQENDETPRQLNSDASQHFNNETVPHSREKKPERLSLTEKSSPRATDHKQGDEEKRFRVVQEQNDSLFIKVKAQPSDSSGVPSNKAVNFVELSSFNNMPQNHPKNAHRNFRDGCSINKLSSFSDSLQGSERKDVPDVRRGERRPAVSVRTRIFSKSDANVEKPSFSRKADKEWKGEKPVVEPQQHSPDESSQGSPKKMPSDSKPERLVGSGRISVYGKKRKNKNRKKRGNADNQELPNQTTDTASGSAIVMTQNSGAKMPRNEQCEAETQKSHAQCKDVSNQDVTKPPVSHDNEHARSSNNNPDAKETEGKKKSCELVIEKCLDKDLAKSDLLDTSFDLDQDPPEGDQFDDEEWEDIDEEVCIDLIAGGEDSYEDNPLDISDDTLDQLISVRMMPSRGHKVVDWAAEMESVEHNSVSEKQEATSLVSNLPEKQSP